MLLLCVLGARTLIFIFFSIPQKEWKMAPRNSRGKPKGEKKKKEEKGNGILYLLVFLIVFTEALSFALSEKLKCIDFSFIKETPFILPSLGKNYPVN